MKKKYIVEVLCAILIAVLLRMYVIAPMVMRTDAVSPSVKLGSFIMVSRLCHNFNSGEIIAFYGEPKKVMLGIVNSRGSDDAPISITRNGEIMVVDRDDLIGRVVLSTM